MITMKDMGQIDLRIGQIVGADPIPKADRLLRVRVDLGTEFRDLVAGLAAYYSPDELVGIKVAVVANMEPAMIRGVRSEGMLLGAGCSSGRDVALLTVTKDVPNGTPIE
jgi:methionyl-tRNA synthetase